MNIKAFNINSEINEKEFYPENYILDKTFDKDVFDFFDSQKNNEILFQKKALMNIENEEEEEDSSESSELVYSKFPDNISLSKNNIYNKMNIKENIIKAIIDEYIKLKNKIINDFNNNINNNNFLKEDKFVFNPKEFNNYDNTPSDEFIKKKILPFKSNEYLMKNINKSFKLLKSLKKKKKKEINKLSQWIYTFLLFLESPLTPENSADLYSINKYIYNNFMKSSELKIIFVIICEIYKQILIL